MAILKRATRKPQIDLSGPDGNAFVLLGLAQRYAKELGLDGGAVTVEMKAGNYYHLITTFDKHFGAYVDLVATKEE